MNRRTVISLTHDLPARPRELSPDSLSTIFGGACPQSTCSISSQDCCYGHRCMTVMTPYPMPGGQGIGGWSTSYVCKPCEYGKPCP